MKACYDGLTFGRADGEGEYIGCHDPGADPVHGDDAYGQLRHRGDDERHPVRREGTREEIRSSSLRAVITDILTVF